MKIRKAVLPDSKEICDIYNYYINNTIVTFEKQSISVNEMNNRVSSVKQQHPWLVCELNKKVIDYAYANAWRTREAYKNTVESAVYIHPEFISKGVDTLLYRELINQLQKTNIHAIIGGISLPNKASIALHEKFGFEKVAHFKEVGFKFNKWIDVGYWELLFNN